MLNFPSFFLNLQRDGVEENGQQLQIPVRMTRQGVCCTALFFSEVRVSLMDNRLSNFIIFYFFYKIVKIHDLFDGKKDIVKL